MAHLVEVAFRGNRKEFFLWDYPDPPALKSAVIVDVDRGEDLGVVHSLGELAQVRNGGCAHGCGTSAPTRKALRLATPKDKATANELAKQNEDARRKAMERVRANGLAMKLCDAEWQWDKKKLTFYFTAEKRVDFRNLVRDLASLFRTRIELKQIGVRDEAKRLDGIGRCGRQYCSASWLPELRPVNLGVAKDQRLSLNPAQISGACGRLMCCLRYEHEFYVQSRKRFPKEGKIVVTARGEEKVLAIDIFRERLTLKSSEGEPRFVSLADFNREVAGLSGRSAVDTAATDDDSDSSFEVSPELMYTTEHEIPPTRDSIVAEATAGDPVATEDPVEGDPAEPTRAGDRDDSGAKRRRGRRGGRRGRGNEQGER
ncbi:MAG TPA: regulatory iron-sulfur-containing complex subunit RicT [Gemmatimonadaceae bacterium]|nr:regulatory iron-sulfur-containing complex subunit RicT [Gemmatimonadaceae bacterium]